MDELNSPQTPPPAEAGPSVDDLNAFGISKDIADVLRGGIPSESQGGPATTAEPPADPAASSGTSAAPDGGTEGAPPASPPSTEPGSSPQPDARDAQPDQAAQLAELRGTISALQAQLNARQEPQRPQPQQGEPAFPSYAMQIPQPIVDGIASEDANVRARAIQQIVAGIGAAVHRNVREEIVQLARQVPEIATTQYRQLSYGERIFNDFYSTFDKLNDPSFYPMVEAESNEWLRRNQGKPWSVQARNEVGAAVYRRLGWQMPAAMPRPNGATPPPAIIPPTNRPGSPAVSPEQQQMLDVLQFN